MINLKVSRDEKLGMELAGESSHYPYGTQIELEGETLKRLGFRDLPAVGKDMKIECKVIVTAARMTPDGQKSITLQITHMEIDDDEDDLTRDSDGAVGAVAKKLGRM